MNPRHVNFLGGGSPCPLHVFLHFNLNNLEKITLKLGSSFELFFLGSHEREAAVIEWFQAYLQGEHPVFPLPLSPTLKPFTWRVLCALQNIPFGKTQSYLDVAANVGNAKASRAVGNACRVNPFPLILPCHRVINTGGSLGGFAYGLEMKQRLLEFERMAIQTP
ncbi:MAG: Methylated-DNA--protein-cysteine methyltransferase, constitutive [Chlamydiae bacterium]|nr:Methylated-DNA--protein-cysteine methyltransferase, constitutive [Chlamydiota bacterium]